MPYDLGYAESIVLRVRQSLLGVRRLAGAWPDLVLGLTRYRAADSAAGRQGFGRAEFPPDRGQRASGNSLARTDHPGARHISEVVLHLT